jgi:hypothetical protein
MSNHTAINIDRTYKMQLPFTKTDNIFKAIAALFKDTLNDSYFEKWRDAQDEIVQLRREIYALKRSAFTERSMHVRFAERPILDLSPTAQAIDAGHLDSPV